MRKRLISLLLALVLLLGLAPALGLTAEAADVAINSTNFPDANFRSFVKKYDTDSNGKLSASELSAVLEMLCSEKEIASLKGIEYFTDLQKLECDHNQLTALDVSANTDLKTLKCGDNQLTSLKLGSLVNLTSLVCSGNQLSSLTVKNCPALEVLYCGSNQLQSLDLSGCGALRMFQCEFNALTALDLSWNSKLAHVRCDSNEIAELKLGSNPRLRYLESHDNRITFLDLSGTATIRDAVLYGSRTSVGTYCYYMYTDSTATTRFYVDNAVTLLTDSRGIAVNAANFPDANFRAVVTTFDTNSNGWLSRAELTAVEKISCNGKSISSLEGIGFFGSLQRLYCYSNNLTELDLRKNPRLTILRCNNNQLTSLNVSSCTALTELRCQDNDLSALDVTKLTELTYLACGNNPLKTLNVTKNKKLEKLYCYQNQLTGLDVMENTALTVLSCFGNSLTAINLTYNGSLEELYCQQNKLGSLSLSGCPHLRICSCFSNKLQSLNLNYNEKLINLDCHSNKIAHVNITPAKGLCYAYQYGTRSDYGTYSSWWTVGTTLIADNSMSLAAGDPNPFVDVKTSDPYYNAVLWAYYHGPCQVTNGTDETHFSPTKTVTRGQAVRFLWNAVGQPDPASTANPFTDNKSGKFYYTAVLWAYYNDPQITDGTTPTTFSPNNTCNRAQIITFLWKALGKPEPTISNPYSDVPAGKYYTKAAIWAYEKGIERGEGGKFNYKTDCTRAAIVLYMYRFYTGKDLVG